VDVEALSDERRWYGRRNRVVLARPCRCQVGDNAQRIVARDGGNARFTGESAYKP